MQRQLIRSQGYERGGGTEGGAGEGTTDRKE